MYSEALPIEATRTLLRDQGMIVTAISSHQGSRGEIRQAGGKSKKMEARVRSSSPPEITMNLDMVRTGSTFTQRTYLLDPSIATYS